MRKTAAWEGCTDSYDWAEMTIKKVDGQWYIHDYPYPYTPMKLYYAIHYMDRENFNVAVRDADGVDISERIIELWYNVNYIYNVDATYPFLPVHREQLMPGHRWNPYQQMLNFDAVTDMYLTKNGKSQLFEAEVGLDGEDGDIKITFFHRLEDGTVWKHPSWKTGWSCAESIADCTVKEMGKDRMVLSIEISSSVDDMGEDPSSFVPSFGWLEITIAKEDGQWKVDDYCYPD